LIYIRDLFPTISSRVKVLSYIDDISLTVSSSSLCKNVEILEREVATLYNKASLNAIEFDLQKTELIHFSTSHLALDAKVTLPSGELITSKEVVKWLGIHFDNRLSFKQHVLIRSSQAYATFNRMCRLVNTERGLSALATQQLYTSCIHTVADYGSQIWWRGQKGLIKPLQLLQNAAIRKILGVFRTALIKAIEVEAGLLPVEVRLQESLRLYRLRTLQLQPTHPISLGLLKDSEYVLEHNTTKVIQISTIRTLIDISNLERPWPPTIPS
jgi:hypothetical protein